MTNISDISAFPALRMRRMRSSPWVRDLAQEHRISVKNLIWPLFVIEGKGQREAVASMPGVERMSVDLAVEAVKGAYDLGIPAVALFPITPADKKTADGREACHSANLICRTVYAIKKDVPGIGVITDVALDPYTTHGHDGLLQDGVILNDETVEVLCRQAVVQAQAGADIIAPSDMMDGRVGAIRKALDHGGYTDRIILSYAAKYASAFYGPFRDAVQSSGCLTGDKKTYQMNPANSDEALREVALDLAEGADMVMVKPGLPYLDIIRNVKQAFHVPTFAYQVSGEYAMLQAAAENGWLNYDAALMETLISFKRAGADGILTYAALDAARLIASK
ncbi:MAG: porphobilinogen synthase [Alphaproteobacteria bacterium]|nr:porphobilinogen synthase [Alphaproteobacteria bacterium]QQS56200.1 MAG: porphobilinogen synthase [Alphaproteobacteria bacterium]